jgi:hypothetical protein
VAATSHQCRFDGDRRARATGRSLSREAAAGQAGAAPDDTLSTRLPVQLRAGERCVNAALTALTRLARAQLLADTRGVDAALAALDPAQLSAGMIGDALDRILAAALDLVRSPRSTWCSPPLLHREPRFIGNANYNEV